MSSSTYKVNSIFRSIQGEGIFTGWPATFVRFQGCNLKCPFCDTPEAIPVTQEDRCESKVSTSFTEMGLDSLVKRILFMVGLHDLIIFTGGEPCLQPIEHLAAALAQEGVWPLHLETNGTLPIPSNMDWIVLSPKQQQMPFTAVWYLANEIKWLIAYPADLGRLLLTVEEHQIPPSKVCLQPISQDPLSTELAYRAALKFGYRLSIQVHKYIGVE